MINKLDLELFEILDNEINKEANYGCYFVLDGEICICEKEYLFSTNIYDKARVIGHYPTTNIVLRFINKNSYYIDEVNNSFGYIDFLRIKIKTEFLKKFNKPYIIYELDITKEIKDYTDEQKKELLIFLNLICKNY